MQGRCVFQGDTCRKHCLKTKMLNLLERYKKMPCNPKTQNTKLQLSIMPQSAHDVFGGRTCHWPLSAEGSENTCDAEDHTVLRFAFCALLTLSPDPRLEPLSTVIASNVLFTSHLKTATLWYSGTEELERERRIILNAEAHGECV